MPVVTLTNLSKDPYLDWLELSHNQHPGLPAAAPSGVGISQGAIANQKIAVLVEVIPEAEFRVPGPGSNYQTLLTDLHSWLGESYGAHANLDTVAGFPYLTGFVLASATRNIPALVRRVEFGILNSADTAPGLAVTVAGEPGRSIVAIIDDGLPFAHPKVRGNVLGVWDQTQGGSAIRWAGAPAPFGFGRALGPVEIIDMPPAEEQAYRVLSYKPMTRSATHGAAVTGIVAGDLKDSRHRVKHAASANNFQYVFVQLPERTVQDTSGGTLGPHVYMALLYALTFKEAEDTLTANISFGSYGGPHNGESLVEKALDNLVTYYPRAGAAKGLNIVVSAGNAALSSMHANFSVSKNVPVTLKWRIPPDDLTDTYMEIWYPNSANDLQVSLTSPSGAIALPATSLSAGAAFDTGGGALTCAILHCSNTSRAVTQHMTLLALRGTRSPNGASAEHGDWVVNITSSSEAPTEVDAYIQRDDPCFGSARPYRQSRFVVDGSFERAGQLTDSEPISTANTFSSLAGGTRTYAIAGHVGSYGPLPLLSPSAPYSSLGPTRGGTRITADYSAPSEQSKTESGILSWGARSGHAIRVNGTSIAAPFFTRQLALAHFTGRLAATVYPGAVPQIA